MIGRRPKVALVVQRAGHDVNGGAEALCRDVALRLAAMWDVTIITTTAVDYLTWAPEYPAGAGNIDGVPVLRFDVDELRDRQAFDRMSERIVAHRDSPPPAEQEAWMRVQGPYSTTLLRHLEDHGAEYDLVFFYTYLYATTYYGLPLVRDRAVLVPFAHDEWPIHLPMWDQFFTLPREVVLSTPEERAFLQRRFRMPFSGPIIGIGVDPPGDAQGARFCRRFAITDPYAVYVGRIDPSKGCAQLFADFSHARSYGNDDLTLVLLGRAAMPIPDAPYLRALGFVDEQTKFDALAGSEMLIMPSALESLSISLLEAWSLGRPALVNAASDVLVGQSRRANAGLWYSDAAEMAAAIPILRGEAGETLGANGREFVQRAYTWETIVEKYQTVYDGIARPAIVRG